MNPPSKPDSPGVYFPPPLLYALIFLAAALLQRKLPITDSGLHSPTTQLAGAFFLLAAAWLLGASLRQFFVSKNTLLPIKPAASLQSAGIYGRTRNPMYVGLALVYLGAACFLGNWWHLVLFPLLLWLVQAVVIGREEQYLTRRFGHDYLVYKTKVRRWL